jgi:hypothetical protein
MCVAECAIGRFAYIFSGSLKDEQGLQSRCFQQVEFSWRALVESRVHLRESGRRLGHLGFTFTEPGWHEDSGWA